MKPTLAFCILIAGCNNSSGNIGLQNEGGPSEARKVTIKALR
jgi:hypothetical protein